MNADYDNINESCVPLYDAEQSSVNDAALDVREVLQCAILDNFKYGINVESFIELERLRCFINKQVDQKFVIDDADLKNKILEIGHQFEGKVYIVKDETKNLIIKTVNDIFCSGSLLIFYNVFYDVNSSWLFSEGIVSEVMLKSILKIVFPSAMFKKNYFTFNHSMSNEHLGIESEIVRVWGDDILLNYEQLSERLPYIPKEKIALVLSIGGCFIWNSPETYSHIGLIDIDESEYVDILDFTYRHCNEKGYASFNELPLDTITERNYDISLTALQDAVYKICLEKDYNRRGKIIVLKGNEIDASDIIREYCRSVERCSLDSLLEFEKDLTGECHRWIPMEVASSELIRIDENDFVADKYVDFDIDAIDGVLKEFITEDYLPLKSFTTFAIFPSCGQIWNLFLLESYCRRFSKDFRFESLSVNSRNAGIIINKDCELSYEDILVDAIKKSNIQLEKEVILGFLFTKGFTGRRSYAKFENLINRLRNI